MAYRLLGATSFIQSGVSDVLLSPTTRAAHPAAVDLVKDCLTSADPAALRHAVVSISLNRPDLSSCLATLRTPTLVITGSDHKGWTPEQAEAASRLLPDGSFAVVDDAAYLVPLEAPDATSDLVSRFWASHLAPDSPPSLFADQHPRT